MYPKCMHAFRKLNHVEDLEIYGMVKQDGYQIQNQIQERAGRQLQRVNLLWALKH